MGRESNTWSSNLKPHLDRAEGVFYQRIEDALAVGIPDVFLGVHGAGAWYELKYLRAFPKRDRTPVRLDYRNNQFTWAMEWIRTGGQYGLITQVGREYFLHDRPEDLREIVDETFTQSEFRGTARIVAAPSREFVKDLLTYHIYYEGVEL